MKYILIDNENVVIYISDTFKVNSTNEYYLVDNNYIAVPIDSVKEVYEINNLPENIETYKYCYDGNEFTDNPNYVAPVEPVTLDDLQEEILDIQLAIVELYEMMEV